MALLMAYRKVLYWQRCRSRLFSTPTPLCKKCTCLTADITRKFTTVSAATKQEGNNECHCERSLALSFSVGAVYMRLLRASQ